MDDHQNRSVIDRQAFLAFIGEFGKESDRAAVILGAAKLDVLLLRILRAALLPNPSASDNLLEGDAPVGSFSARIDLCFRLGLIDAQFARALHLVRRIRNEFAHEPATGTLESGAHRNRVRELVAPLQRLPEFEEWQEDYPHDKMTAGSLFRAALAIMAAELEVQVNYVSPIAKGETLQLIPLGWGKTT